MHRKKTFWKQSEINHLNFRKKHRFSCPGGNERFYELTNNLDASNRPSRLKKCSHDWDDHMETLQRRSQTTRIASKFTRSSRTQFYPSDWGCLSRLDPSGSFAIVWVAFPYDRPDRLHIFLRRLGRCGRSGRSYGNQTFENRNHAIDLYWVYYLSIQLY